MRHTSVQRAALKSANMSRFFYRKKENSKDLAGTGMASVIHQYSFDSCTCADADVQCHVGRVNGVVDALKQQIKDLQHQVEEALKK